MSNEEKKESYKEHADRVLANTLRYEEKINRYLTEAMGEK